jgi:SAM-dependent methyltransferase
MRRVRLAWKILRTVVRQPSSLKRVLGVLPHDELYDRDYFAHVEQTTSESADVIVQSVLDDLQPSSVLDVGCGTGVLLGRLRDAGVQAYGLERAQAALQHCRRRGLDVEVFDVVTDALPDRMRDADVVVSIEVGHQLPPSATSRYVDLLSSARRAVVFSSNVPGSGDRDPRNEQPHEFWIARFAERGFRHDEELTATWRQRWRDAGTAPWFSSNVLVFRRA